MFKIPKKNVEVAIDENRIMDLAGEANLSNSMSIGDQERLVEMLNDLKEDQIAIIELRFFQEMSFKEQLTIWYF